MRIISVFFALTLTMLGVGVSPLYAVSSSELTRPQGQALVCGDRTVAERIFFVWRFMGIDEVSVSHHENCRLAVPVAIISVSTPMCSTGGPSLYYYQVFLGTGASAYMVSDERPRIRMLEDLFVIDCITPGIVTEITLPGIFLPVRYAPIRWHLQ